MEARGCIFKYGDNVDTDVIIPARYLNNTTGEELAKHCMEDIDKDFVFKVKKGDIIVARKNFGCGSSREHAPLAIKSAGISCVIADKEAAEAINSGDEVEVNFDTGIIKNITTGEEFQGQAFPEFMQNIINAGGLVAYVNGKRV